MKNFKKTLKHIKMIYICRSVTIKVLLCCGCDTMMHIMERMHREYLNPSISCHPFIY